MKKSEMEKLLLNGLCDLGQWHHLPPEGVASALSLLLKPKDGWEPEEPELPKLLLIHAGAVVEDNGTFYHIVAAPREAPGRTERNAKILAAMAAAYNREQQGEKALNLQDPDWSVDEELRKAKSEDTWPDDLTKAEGIGGGWVVLRYGNAAISRRNYRDLTFAQANEVLRRYRDEPRLRERMENIQRCADRSDQLVDRWKGVVERALDEARSPGATFERILAILEERA